MMEHLHQDQILGYLSGNVSKEAEMGMNEHLASCEECFERVKALVYLKKNFEELWKTLSISEIEKLKEKLEFIKKQRKNAEGGKATGAAACISENRGKGGSGHVFLNFNKRLYFAVSAVAAAVIIVFATLFSIGVIKTGSEYSQWVHAGIVAKNVNLNREIGKAELSEILTNLAGMDINAGKHMKDADTFKVSDAAEAISSCFKLHDSEKSSMTAGMKLDEILTYEKALGLIDNFAGGVYSPDAAEKGSFKNLAVNSDGMLLQDMTITGNLYLLQGIGEGEATLKNVEVWGRVYVLGGGMSSIILENSRVEDMVVNKGNGKVRVYAKEGTEISAVQLDSGAKLENEGHPAAFGQVKVNAGMPMGSEIKLAGHFNSINVQAGVVSVSVEKGTVKEIDVSEEAAGLKLDVSKDALVENLSSDVSVDVKGEGEVRQDKKIPTISPISKGDSYETVLEKLVGTDELKEMEPQKMEHYLREIRIITDVWNNIDRLEQEMATGDGVVLNGYLYFEDGSLKQCLDGYLKIETAGFSLNSLDTFIREYGRLFEDEAVAAKVYELAGKIPDNAVKMSDVEGIRSLSLDACWLDNADALKYFKNLSSLAIESFSRDKMHNLQFLESLDKLESLSIGCFPDTCRLSPIGSLSNLKQLSISGRGRTPPTFDLSFMSSLSSLESLTFVYARSDDFSPLAGLKNLKSLTADLGGGRKAGLDSAISGLSGLTFLHLEGVNIEDTDFLSGLKHLKQLYLSTNPSDISGLLGLSSLEEMYVHPQFKSESTYDLSPLFGLKSMRSLTLKGLACPVDVKDRIYQELQEMHMNGEITLDEETEFQMQREAEYVEAKKQELVDALPGCSISFVR